MSRKSLFFSFLIISVMGRLFLSLSVVCVCVCTLVVGSTGRGIKPPKDKEVVLLHAHTQEEAEWKRWEMDRLEKAVAARVSNSVSSLPSSSVDTLWPPSSAFKTVTIFCFPSRRRKSCNVNQRTLCPLTTTQCFNDRPHFCLLNTAVTSIHQLYHQTIWWCKTPPVHQSTATLATMSSSIATAATMTYSVTSKRIKSYPIALLLPNWTYRRWTTAGRTAAIIAPIIRTDSLPRPFTWVSKRSASISLFSFLLID